MTLAPRSGSGSINKLDQQFEHDPGVLNVGRQMRCHEQRVGK
jgi:hypothetical protein